MYECIENYEENKWFYFYIMMVHAADICEDQFYLKQKHEKGLSGVKVDSNDQKQKGI